MVDAGHGKESPLSVYMVFPYMDHDLAGLLENERVKLSPQPDKALHEAAPRGNGIYASGMLL